MNAVDYQEIPRVLQFGYRNNEDRPGPDGEWFWCVGLPDGREVSLWADRLEVMPGGTLLALHDPDKPGPSQVFGFAPGSWLTFYLADVIEAGPAAAWDLSPVPT